MNKINLIIQREYLERVRKKSFLVMTILGPLLMAALVVIPALLATMNDDKSKNIAVMDNSNRFTKELHDTLNLKFSNQNNKSLADLKKDFTKSGFYALVVIPDSTKSDTLKMYSDKPIKLDISYQLRGIFEKLGERQRMKKAGISEQKLAKLKDKFEISTNQWTKQGTKENFTEVAMILGYITSLIIYMFVFMYGAMVMRGVIEEKTSRVVEVIVSSVRPFQLMMGKVIGIALVALTQFLLWIVLTFGIISITQVFMKDSPAAKQISMEQSIKQQTGQNIQLSQNSSAKNEFQVRLESLSNFNIPLIIICFIIYFIGGYLLYAGLFAAVGSAVDNETDTQQFMLPISIPLIISIVAAQGIIRNPDGALAFWLSIIPLTSPVAMMVRIPFGVGTIVPIWQLILSIGILILAFLGTIWLAAKIYRTGILMYGKKVSYKELWKWLRYKN